MQFSGAAFAASVCHTLVTYCSADDNLEHVYPDEAVVTVLLLFTIDHGEHRLPRRRAVASRRCAGVVEDAPGSRRHMHVLSKYADHHAYRYSVRAMPKVHAVMFTPPSTPRSLPAKPACAGGRQTPGTADTCNGSPSLVLLSSGPHDLSSTSDNCEHVVRRLLDSCSYYSVTSANEGGHPGGSALPANRQTLLYKRPRKRLGPSRCKQAAVYTPDGLASHEKAGRLFDEEVGSRF
ncbi:unnamed protein product [Rangifer tarandus platyrhynchus]|uniref:Uncharacterized protein n=1 Tax=Rangifer tarandus platyrhynchus TaxID=3082113 RepID=A0ACB1KF52_RANTA